MNFKAFLRDRGAYMVIYAVFGLLTITVVQLDLWLSHASLQFANLIYILVLGLVGLLLFLFLDYQRQREFFARLQEMGDTESMDRLSVLPKGHTMEQKLYADAWGRFYARVRAELNAEQQRGKRHLQLVSQWAHQMKTPVAVIDLELQKARQQGWPADPQGVMDSIAEENQRLQHSLQALLNAVRLEDFSEDFRVETVDLLQAVRNLINEHKRDFIVQRVYPKLEAATEQAPWLVASDAKWLHFILEQVLSNAIKYASRPDRDGQVLFRLDRDGGDTLLAIEDNGIGIVPEDLGRVFSPFYTGVNGRDYPQATGMGLTLARDACQRLGHGIELMSQRGEGTKVTLRFAPDKTIFVDVASPNHPPSCHPERSEGPSVTPR